MLLRAANPVPKTGYLGFGRLLEIFLRFLHFEILREKVATNGDWKDSAIPSRIFLKQNAVVKFPPVFHPGK